MRSLISKTDILLLRAELHAFWLRVHGFFVGLMEILRTTENWWAALGVYCGIMENVYVRFRHTPISFFVTKDNWKDYHMLRKILLSTKIHYLGGNRFRFSHPRGLEFNCDGEVNFFAHSSEMDCYHSGSKDVVCEVAGLKFITPFPYGTFELREIFVDKTYGEPCCNNAVVVDVGAFIGDSSLFFASRGAKLVIAFEPVPVLFDILKKNVTLNGFEKVIDTKNEAVGDHFGTVNIGYIPTRPGSSGENPVEQALFFEVASTPLSEVIMSQRWVDILKIDCEGCEHKALQHAGKNGALKRVGMIIVEVHSGVRSLIELLKSEGFKITQLRRIMEKRWILVARARALKKTRG